MFIALSLIPVRFNTIIRSIISLYCLTGYIHTAYGQCSSSINIYPYSESFEIGAGGCFAGGVGSDWAWGVPSKPVISLAGAGTCCWIVGGLTRSSYANSEALCLQSPCFDFSSLQYPYTSFKIFGKCNNVLMMLISNIH